MKLKELTQFNVNIDSLKRTRKIDTLNLSFENAEEAYNFLSHFRKSDNIRDTVRKKTQTLSSISSENTNTTMAITYDGTHYDNVSYEASPLFSLNETEPHTFAFEYNIDFRFMIYNSNYIVPSCSISYMNIFYTSHPGAMEPSNLDARSFWTPTFPSTDYGSNGHTVVPLGTILGGWAINISVPGMPTLHSLILVDGDIKTETPDWFLGFYDDLPVTTSISLTNP